MESTKMATGKTEPGESVARLQSLEIGEPLHKHADEALRFIEQHQGFTYTPEQDKAVLKKIDRHLMPLVSGPPG
jgi:gentisate 1,2-dioxygenase